MNHRALRPHTLLRYVAAVALTIGSLVPVATATPLESSGGAIGLPVSGLHVDVPAAAPGCSYRLSGSWSLDEFGAYDGRDVIDEACGDSLTAGTWISVGYFTAGDDAAVVAAVDLTDDWAAEADLWGAHWNVRGGIFDLGDLGPTPAVVLCTRLGEGKALLLHHFFLGAAQPMPQAAVLGDLERGVVPQAAWRAYAQGQTAPASPTHRDEIRNRGAIDPTRSVQLELMGIDVALPDDGCVWLLEHDDETTTDFLIRMAPALPEVRLETTFVTGVDGPTVFAGIELEQRDVPPRNLPDGWQPGPQLVVGGEPELTASYEFLDGVLVVGVFQGPENTDVAHLAPMFEAILEGATGSWDETGDE